MFLLPWSLWAENTLSVFRSVFTVTFGRLWMWLDPYTYKERDIWPSDWKEKAQICSSDLKKNAQFVS